jgi:hypothetical protein
MFTSSDSTPMMLDATVLINADFAGSSNSDDVTP